MKKWDCFFRMVTISVLLLTQLVFTEVKVQITSPTASTLPAACQEFTIEVDVQATEQEEVERVKFYSGKKTLGSDRTPPYSKTVKIFNDGWYDLYAVAVLEDKSEIKSEELNFAIGNHAPGQCVYNSTFECAALSPWALRLRGSGAATATIVNDGQFGENEYLKIDIENGGTEIWYVGLGQTVSIDSGHVYTISFLAYTPEAKTIWLEVGSNTVIGDHHYSVRNTKLDAGVKQYSYTFESPKHSESQQFLNIIPGGNEIPIWLDNISLIDTTAAYEARMKGPSGVEASLRSQTVSNFQLFPAYPNPFNMQVTIPYTLNQPSDVLLNIYNVRGEKVKTLVDLFHSAGNHRTSWNGTDNRGMTVPSGMYIYRLQVPEQAVDLSGKILLTK